VRGSLFQTSPARDGVAVAGEVDRVNARIVHAALAARCATHSGSRDSFVVELGGLDFLDLAGAKAMVTGTGAHRAGGGVVRLRAPQPRIERLLRLLGVDRLDGFRVEGS
jgi:anti-anti-sigma factor